MAGDWIKFEISTHEKPEVWAIAERLDVDPDAVVGKLLRVWAWFDQHTEDGAAPLSVKMMLDRNVGLPGFCDAVISSGWMHVHGEIIALDDFDKHNGRTAKRRINTAKRVAAHKAKKSSGNAEGNAGGNGELTENDRASIPRPIRAEVYKRDNESCRYCGRRKGEYAPPETASDSVLSIDHVIPVASGGANEIANMVTACMACNRYKGDRTPDEANLEWPLDEHGKRYGSVTSALPKEEKRREEKNKKKSPPVSPQGGKAKRAAQLPEDFEPNETNKRLAEELGVSLITEFPQFCDHHRAKGSTMKDWHAAMNTWIRNAHRFGRSGNRQAQQGRKETPQERGERMARERGLA